MNNLIVPIAGFIISAAVIIFSGSRLSFYGDRIAELSGMGKAWVGLILMASVTSLPELMTGISSVAIVNAPDLAAGDIFGSCMFNLLILSVLDARIQKPLFSMVKSSHIVTAIFSIVLLTVTGLAIYVSDAAPVILWISIFTLALFGLYLLAVWSIFKYEHQDLVRSKPVTPSHLPSNAANLHKTIGWYALHAFIVIAAAVFLPYFGERIAAQTGIGNSFFGTLFLAAATSLPELVVSLAALKLGALDMAVGNLLGSNVFNIFILGIDDVFYREGSIFAALSSSHLVSVLVTIIMSAVVALGLLFKPPKKQLWLLSFDTFIIIILYLTVVIYLYFN